MKAVRMFSTCGSPQHVRAVPGQDPQDATSSSSHVQDYTAALRQTKDLDNKPLQGKRIGVIAGMMSSGVAAGVATAVQSSIVHLESLGAEMCEVNFASPARRPWACLCSEN